MTTEQRDGDRRRTGKEGTAMEILVALALVVAWIIFQVWVLPRLGVKT
jgi:flagellar biogenesis protein FliO